MDAAAGRGGSLPVASSSSQPPRKEWRAASDHSFRNGKEDSEHGKLGQPDERTIFEEGVGSLDADFCTIRIDSGNNDPLQQQLRHISMQRQELQRMEIELRAQAIAKSEILDVQNNYEAQLKEQSGVAAKLKEKLRESEERIRELELKIEEKDRELHAVNSEAAWAKEDFLREQSEKLANFRRERDSLEAERAQHLKQIHELQGHIKEKESQFLALEEQHRVAQDTILFKDGQLKDAQAWIARLQEMGALQQAELREHVDQFHQYYMSLQRQFVDMERHHLQAIQQLQLELTEARERNGVTSDGLQSASRSSLDSSVYVQSQGDQNNATNDSGTSDVNPKLTPNGKLDDIPSSISSSNTFTKAEYVPGIPVVPSSIVRMSGFIPPGQVNPLPRFVMHTQSSSQPASSNSVSLPPHNTFQATVTRQYLQNQQAVPDALPIPNQNEHQVFQPAQNLLESGAHYSHELPVERGKAHEDNLNTHIDRKQMSDAIINGSSMETQVLEPDAERYRVSPGSEDSLSINSQFHSTFAFDPSEQQTELEYKNKTPPIRQPQEPGSNSSQHESISSVTRSTGPSSSVTSNISAECKDNMMTSSESSVLVSRPTNSMNSERAKEPSLLDERALLACIVRAIPAGSGNGIKMSTTLPNRLGKMLAPLHWHDYKKQYGKLDDFVACHPELFVIEGDFINLREGAQEIISATAAVAKVAAATASSTPYSAQFPSVAVTPVAQSSRLKRTLLTDSKPLTTIATVENSINPRNSGDNFNTTRGISDGKSLGKTKDLHVSDVSCGRTGPSPIQGAVVNGGNTDRTVIPPSQNKVLSDGRHGVRGRRSTGAGSISWR